MNPLPNSLRTPTNHLGALPVTRRRFLEAALTSTVLAGGSGALLGVDRGASSAPETLVATLYRSLTPAQKSAVTFPFDHPLRSKVDNNWNITKPTIAEFFNADQREMIRQIFMGIHSPEYVDVVMRQVEHDGGKEGFGGGSIALFGEPGTGKFEFVLTGRHVTRRCDGDSVEGAAFGGPIFYGHAAQGENEKADHPGNAYWFQARRANEVFQAMDGRQRALALLGTGRGEDGTDTVTLTGKTKGLPGIPMTELAKDQQALVRGVFADLLAPFRKRDADEALKLIDQAGFEHLHMAFFKNQDIGNDGVWDVWQIEGPSMLWYFRGKPHVHTWVHICDRA